jgi:hypothetical protein
MPNVDMEFSRFGVGRRPIKISVDPESGVVWIEGASTVELTVPFYLDRDRDRYHYGSGDDHVTLTTRISQDVIESRVDRPAPNFFRYLPSFSIALKAKKFVLCFFSPSHIEGIADEIPIEQSVLTSPG